MNGNDRIWWLVAGTMVTLLAGAVLYRVVFSGTVPSGLPADQPPQPPNPPAAVTPEPAPPPTPMRPEINAALFDRLLYGMTETDVRAILQTDPDTTKTEYIPAGEFTEPRRIYWMIWEDLEKKRRLRLGLVNGKLEEKVLELIEKDTP